MNTTYPVRSSKWRKIFLFGIFLFFCFLVKVKAQKNVVPEQRCLEFFSEIIIQQLEFKKGEKNFFKGHTENKQSNYYGIKKELMIFEANEYLFEELDKIKEIENIESLKLNVEVLDFSRFNLNCKKKKDYELLIYKSTKLANSVYFTKMILRNNYKGITIFVLIDENGKIKFQLNSFII